MQRKPLFAGPLAALLVPPCLPQKHNQSHIGRPLGADIPRHDIDMILRIDPQRIEESRATWSDRPITDARPALYCIGLETLRILATHHSPRRTAFRIRRGHRHAP